MQIHEVINGIDDMNCEMFLNLLNMMVLEILIANNIFNILGHKVKNVHLVEDLHLFGILSFHNEQNAALILMILMDFWIMSDFSLKINFIVISTEIDNQCVHKAIT